MNIYSIYKATNLINNKVYIGFDSNWPNRKYSHKQHFKKYKNKRFYKAISKYGWDNFEWQVIYQSKDKNHCLSMETFFINEYKSFVGFKESKGYNLNLGGDGNTGMVHSEKTKKLISENTKKSMSDPLIKQRFLEATQSPDYLEKRSKTQKLTLNLPENKEKRKIISTKIHNDPLIKLQKSIKRKQKWDDPLWRKNNTFTCEHCGKSVFISGYTRFHGNKCKSRI